jgi:hypothetical protein
MLRQRTQWNSGGQDSLDVLLDAGVPVVVLLLGVSFYFVISSRTIPQLLRRP